MANNFAYSPWVLDTASGTVAYDGRFRLEAISWEGNGAAADEVEIQDVRGINIFNAVGNANLSPVQLSLDGVWVNKLYLTKLTSGQVKVWVS